MEDNQESHNDREKDEAPQPFRSTKRGQVVVVLDSRGYNLVAMITAVAMIMLVAAAGIYTVQGHHRHTENLLENAVAEGDILDNGPENAAFQGVDRTASKLVPFLVIFALVVTGIALGIAIFVRS